MAAKPVQRALVTMLEERGGVQVAVLDRLASGETLQAIADSLPVPRPDGTIKNISRSFLYDFLNRRYHGQYQVAVKQHADALVDQALQIADATSTESAYAATKARNQIAARHWTAGRLNREKWGESTAPVGNVNIGELHLHALQKFGGPNAKLLNAPNPVPEGDVIELADVEMVEPQPEATETIE